VNNGKNSVNNRKNTQTDKGNQNHSLSSIVVNVAPAEGKGNSAPIKSQETKKKDQSNSSSVSDVITPNGQVPKNTEEQVPEIQTGSGVEKLATIEERASSRCSSKAEKEVKRG